MSTKPRMIASRTSYDCKLYNYRRKPQAETITVDGLLEAQSTAAYLEATEISRIKALIQLAELLLTG